MAWSDGINLDQVRRVEWVNDSKVKVTWQDGGEEVLQGGVARGVWSAVCQEEQKYQLIPAVPGYEIVDVYTTDYQTYREPVIAWKIYDAELTDDRCSTLIAIGMISNLNESGKDYVKALVCPDGRVIPHGSGIAYESLEKWIEHLKNRKAEAAE